MSPVHFANLTFRGLHRRDILSDSGSLKLIITVNAEAIFEANRQPRYARIISENVATLDGYWPFVLARLRCGRPDIEKISGSDFIYDLCEMAADRGLRVFLLGATPETNRMAQHRLRSRFVLDIDGYSPPVHPYPFPEEMDCDILRRIREFRPTVLITAFGAPKQEFWLDQHRAELESAGVRWALNGGGSLDFVAGVVRRAPVFLQRVGLESLWRVALQPRLRFVRLLRSIRFLQYA